MNEKLFGNNNNKQIPLLGVHNRNKNYGNTPQINQSPALYNVPQNSYQPIVSTALPLSDAALPQRISYPSENEVIAENISQNYDPNMINQNFNRNNMPNNQDIPNNKHNRNTSDLTKNEIQALSNKLLFIDNHLTNFGQYLSWLYTMIVFTAIGVFYSIYYFSSDDFFFAEKNKKQNRVEILNFIVNLIYIGGYIVGVQSFLTQDRKKAKIFLFTLIAFCIISVGNYVLYIFVKTTFFTWCTNTFYLIINVVLYYQQDEFSKLVSEKAELKRRYDNIKF